jgi:hypothetical protein
MICQSCGLEAPTKYVEFYQNIGVIVLRFHKQIKGNLCKDCISKHFWPMTMITLFLGWWGVISFFYTLFALPNNIIRYLGSLSLEPTPAGATKPELTKEAIEKIKPHLDDITSRLKNKEKLEKIAEDVSFQAGVTPGQVILYITMLAKISQAQQKSKSK